MRKMTVYVKRVIRMKESTLFVWKYSLAFIMICYSLYFLSKIPIVQNFVSMTMENPLMIGIMVATAVAVVLSIITAINTAKESRIVEMMIANQDEIDFTKTQLPDGEKYGKSLFVEHFGRFSTSQKNHWTDEAKTALEDYLENMIMRVPDLLSSIQDKLPLLGLLGSVLGMAAATLSKTKNDAMFADIGNALGTTVFGIVGSLIVYVLNYIVTSEREALLRTVLVIFRIAQGGSHDEKTEK